MKGATVTSPTAAATSATAPPKSLAHKRHPRPLRPRSTRNPGRQPALVGGAPEGPAPLALGVATLARVSTRLLCPLREPSPLLSGPASLRLSPPREGELEAAEKHPRLRARDAAVLATG